MRTGSSRPSRASISAHWSPVDDAARVRISSRSSSGVMPPAASGSASIAPVQRSTSSSPTRLSRNRNAICPFTSLGSPSIAGCQTRTSSSSRLSSQLVRARTSPNDTRVPRISSVCGGPGWRDGWYSQVASGGGAEAAQRSAMGRNSALPSGETTSACLAVEPGESSQASFEWSASTAAEISWALAATVARSMSAAIPSFAPAHHAQNVSSRCSIGCSASPPPRRRNRIAVLRGFGEGYQRRALPSGVGASMSVGRLGSGFIGGSAPCGWCVRAPFRAQRTATLRPRPRLVVRRMHYAFSRTSYGVTVTEPVMSWGWRWHW